MICLKITLTGIFPETEKPSEANCSDNELFAMAPPQSSIDAFRRFHIPDELQEMLHYPALTKDLKAKVFRLNAAKLFNVNVEAKRKALPKDYLSQITMGNLDEGPTPSYHAYGLIATCLPMRNQ